MTSPSNLSNIHDYYKHSFICSFKLLQISLSLSMKCLKFRGRERGGGGNWLNSKTPSGHPFQVSPENQYTNQWLKQQTFGGNPDESAFQAQTDKQELKQFSLHINIMQQMLRRNNIFVNWCRIVWFSIFCTFFSDQFYNIFSSSFFKVLNQRITFWSEIQT